jgi:hypothetical protein
MLEQQRLQLQQLLRAIWRPAGLPAELLIAQSMIFEKWEPVFR